ARRVKSFPIQPRVALRPDEKGQRWVLSVSTSDRSGLLYAIARVLGKHHINLQLAKVSTLGERVEDTFLVSGPVLQQPKLQLQVESELLDAIGVTRWALRWRRPPTCSAARKATTRSSTCARPRSSPKTGCPAR